MKIVTAGYAFLDIDAYAGIIAYAQLLQLQGESALAVSTAPLNESITPTMREWNEPLQTTYHPNSDDTYTLIDVSEPAYFEKFVDLNRVDEIIDHHPGQEAYWESRIGKNAQIEFVGAACTLVAERWQRSGQLRHIKSTTAQLLMAGILDNTLNFGAQLTTKRDHTAYHGLQAQAGVADDWSEHYFAQVQASVLADIDTALRNDTKTMQLPGYHASLRVGQTAIWDGQAVLGQIHAADGANTFTNILSIGEKRSYFLCDDRALQAWLEQLLKVRFKGNTARADRLWLRKEIMKQALKA